MLKKTHTLPELAEALDISVPRLIEYGLNGRVIIGVFADHWLGTSGPELADTLLEGLVELQPEDLRRSLDAGYTVVREARMEIVKDMVTLNAPVDVMWDVHYVTEEERQRFMRYYRPIEEMHGGEIPPYLDPQHEYYSSTLSAAVRVWIALCHNGGYKPRIPIKKQLVSWLEDHVGELTPTAITNIARIANPDELKKGGDPGTTRL